MGRRLTIAYGRVSTDEQANVQDAAKHQRSRLERYNPDKLFFDVETGRSQTRPGYLEVLKLIREGRVERLIVTRLDRANRSGLDGISLLNLLLENNVTLCCIDEGGDQNLADPAIWRVMAIKAVDAQYEVKNLSRRVLAGRAEARKLGKIIGRIPWGYRRNKQGLPEIDPDVLPLALEAINIFIETGSTLDILRRFKNDDRCSLRSMSAVRYWLVNPFLRGHLHYDKRTDIRYNNHDAIIDEATWRKIQRRKQDNRMGRGYNKNKKIYPMSGLLRCGICGSPLGHDYKGNYFYLKCLSRTYKPNDCDNLCTRESEVRSLVIQKLRDRAADLVAVSLPDLDVQRSPEELALLHQLEQLKRMPINPVIQDAIAQTESQLLQIQNNVSTVIDQAEIDAFVEICSDPLFWELLSEDELRSLFVRFIEPHGISVTKKRPASGKPRSREFAMVKVLVDVETRI